MRRRPILARALVAAFLLSAVAAGASCASLEEIELGACGNRVLDPGEDCDDDSVACGAPGTQYECRYTCDFAAEETSCPDGFSCGAGGTCGRPKDDLVRALEIERGGDAVAIADLDGDRIDDVAIASDAARNLSVRFFAPDLTTVAEQQLPIDSSAMVVGRVDSDDAPDILIASEAALLSVSTSGSDRALVGAAFTPYSFPDTIGRAVSIPSRVAQASEGQTDLLRPDASVEGVLITLGPDGDDPVSSVYMRNPYTGVIPRLAAFEPIRDMADVVAVVRAPLVPRSEAESCDELVVARRDLPSVTVVLLCDENGESSVTSAVCAAGDCMTEIELAEPPQGAFAVQLDADPEMEVLVLLGAAGEPPSDIRVLQRTPEATFELELPSPSAGTDFLSALDDDVNPAPAPVILVGDFDADLAPDFVRTDGIYLSDRGVTFDGLTPTYYRAGAPSGSAWVEAASGDFDGNGLLDVVAAPSQADSDLDLLENTNKSYFNPRRVPADGLTAALTVGDFDGDGAQDLVVRNREAEPQASPPSCDEPDDLVIRFGGDGGLGEGRTIARVAGIEQLVSGPLPRLDKRDSIDDFGVSSRCSTGDEPPTMRIAVFYGAANRLVAAPYVLVNTFQEIDPFPDVLVPYVPETFAVSTRTATTLTVTERPSGAVPPGANPEPLVVFALENDGGATYAEQSVVPLDPVTHASLSASRTRVAFADIAGDGEEVAIVADPLHLHVIRDIQSFPTNTELVTEEMLSTVETIELDLEAARVEALVAIDLDGDGVEEVLVGGSSAAAPFLRVYSDLASGSPIVTDLPVDVGDRVLAIAALAGPSGLDVVVAVQGFGAIAFASAGGELTARDYSPSLEMDDVTSLATGDVNGDHFEDLVLIGTDRTTIYTRALSHLGDEAGEGAE